MNRRFWWHIYIDKDPSDYRKGWSWVELLVDDIKRLSIPTGYPQSYTNLSRSIERRNLPSRGRSGTKKFVVALNGGSIPMRVHKSVTISAVCAWLKTWAAPDTQLVTPGGRTYQISGDKTGNQAHFIYFVFNADSNAIKIGRAKNVSKRLQALQTSSPAALELLKAIPVEGLPAAQALEQALHQQFQSLRLNGEWFRADAALRQYIEKV